MDDSGKTLAGIASALIGLGLGTYIAYLLYNGELVGITADIFGAGFVGLVTAGLVGFVLYKTLHPF